MNKAKVVSANNNATSYRIDLTISPNPARFETNITAIQISNFAHLLIHDAKGNLIPSQSLVAQDPNFTWNNDVSHWSDGKYPATIQSGRGKVTQRLVRAE